jgi:hypothetical protein
VPDACRLLAAGLASLLLLATARAEACICYFMEDAPPTLEDSLRGADVVFLGRPLFLETDEVDYDEVRLVREHGEERIRLPSHLALAEVDVEHVLKGPLPPTTTVRFSTHPAACGNPLEPGIQHLIFAWMHEGILVMDACASSALSRAVDEYVTLLEMTHPERPPPLYVGPYLLPGAPRLGWPPGPTCAVGGQPAGRDQAQALAAAALVAAVLRRMARRHRAG